MTSPEFIETVAGKGYTLHVYTACGLRGIHPAGWRRRIHPASSVDGYTAYVHTAYGESNTPSTSTILVVERETHSRPLCWLMERDTYSPDTAGGRDGYTIHIQNAYGADGCTLHVRPTYTGCRKKYTLHSARIHTTRLVLVKMPKRWETVCQSSSFSQ